MDPEQGRLIRLPLGREAISADAVFEDMLTGWKEQQLARNFTIPDAFPLRLASS